MDFFYDWIAIVVPVRKMQNKIPKGNLQDEFKRFRQDIVSKEEPSLFFFRQKKR